MRDKETRSLGSLGAVSDFPIFLGVGSQLLSTIKAPVKEIDT
jgi:hypothetical protein